MHPNLLNQTSNCPICWKNWSGIHCYTVCLTSSLIAICFVLKILKVNYFAISIEAASLPCRSLFQEMRYIRNIQRSTRCTPGDMGKHRYSNSGRKNPKVFFKEKLKSNGDRKVIWRCLLVLWSMPIWWFSVLMDAKVWWSCKSVMVLKKV